MLVIHFINSQGSSCLVSHLVFLILLIFGFHLTVSNVGSYNILVGSHTVLVTQVSFPLCNICFGSHQLSVIVSCLGSHLIVSYSGSHAVFVGTQSVLIIQFNFSLCSYCIGLVPLNSFIFGVPYC